MVHSFLYYVRILLLGLALAYIRNDDGTLMVLAPHTVSDVNNDIIHKPKEIIENGSIQ